MSRMWHPNEIKILKELYPKYLDGLITMEELSKILNRSWHSIRHKASECKIAHNLKDRINWDLYKKIKKRITL